MCQDPLDRSDMVWIHMLKGSHEELYAHILQKGWATTKAKTHVEEELLFVLSLSNLVKRPRATRSYHAKKISRWKDLQET